MTNTNKITECIKPNERANFSRNLADDILVNLDNNGLGSLTKTEFEALIFHHLRINVDSLRVKDNNDWVRVLRIPPTKLKTLEVLESVKYLNLEDTPENWRILLKAIQGKNIEVEDMAKGTIRFYIDDIHVIRFVEKFVVDNGSSLDYARNRNQVVVKLESYTKLMSRLMECFAIDEDELVRQIIKDKNAGELKGQFTSFKTYFDELKTKLKDKAFDQAAKIIFEKVSNLAFNYIRKKIMG